MLAAVGITCPAKAEKPRPAPRTVAAAVYAVGRASLDGGDDPPRVPPERFYDPALSALFRANEKRAEHGNLMFAPPCVRQDCRIKGLTIAGRRQSGGRAVIDVRLRNMGKPVHLIFALSLRCSSWRVSEVTQPGRNGFVLSAMLCGKRQILNPADILRSGDASQAASDEDGASITGDPSCATICLSSSRCPLRSR